MDAYVKAERTRKGFKKNVVIHNKTNTNFGQIF